MKIPQSNYCPALGTAIDIALTISKNGFQAYPVGGAIRDILINKNPTEVDITTDAPIGVVKKIFPNAKVVFPERYQICRMQFGRYVIEISRMREDIVSYGRQASVEFTQSLSKDLVRRDFTINALALNPENMEIVDNHGGINDLEKKIIRSIGDPQKRLYEDNLRILRAVRFSAQLRFRMESALSDAVSEMAYLTSNLSPAWVFREFSRGIKHNPSMFKKLLDQTNIGESIFGKDWERHSEFDLLNRAKFFKKVPDAILWVLFFGKNSKNLVERFSRIFLRIEFPKKLRKDIIYACELWESFNNLDTLPENKRRKIISNLLYEEYRRVISDLYFER